jgi:hypothetical protein
MKDAVATMGDLLPDDAGGRDAVHVAVISATAGETMHPAQNVGFSVLPTEGIEGTASALADHLGIVDPFLKTNVRPGQRFWLYLYPRTITGLNHQWTHPAFPNEATGTVYGTPGERLASERWIREWAESYDVTYAEMIAAAKAWIESGDYFSRGGTFAAE